MVDGSASLMTLFYGMFASGYWKDERGSNRLDSGAPWYNVYETKDGRWVSVGSNEARFWRNTLALLGLSEGDMPDQHDRSRWPEIHAKFAAIFRTRTRDEWCALAEGREVCIAPVMSLAEAPTHPHLRARQTFVERDGVVQPAPAPRFSRTPGAIQSPPARPGEHTDAVLADWGSRPRNSRRCARRARSRDLNATCRRCRKRPQRVRARFCCSPRIPSGFPLSPRSGARIRSLSSRCNRVRDRGRDAVREQAEPRFDIFETPLQKWPVGSKRMRP